MRRETVLLLAVLWPLNSAYPVGPSKGGGAAAPLGVHELVKKPDPPKTKEVPGDSKSQEAVPIESKISEIESRFAEYKLDPARIQLRGSDVEKSEFLKILSQSVPGEEPTLALFLEETKFAGALIEMKAAWRRGNSLEFPSNPDATTPFFEKFRNRTLVLVGHVEDRHMVMIDREGRVHLHSIRRLMIEAARVGALLIPLGCKSAVGGASMGFKENISTEKIVAFLRELPPRPKFADVFRGMQEIGPLRVDLDPALKLIKASIIDRSTEEAIVTVEVPRFQSYWSLSSVWQSITGAVRRSARTIAGFIIAHPIISLILFAISLSVVSRVVKWLAWSDWFRINRSRQRYLVLVTRLYSALVWLRRVAWYCVPASLVLVTLVYEPMIIGILSIIALTIFVLGSLDSAASGLFNRGEQK